MTALKLTLAAVAALVVSAAASAQTVRLGVSGQGSPSGFRISDVLVNTPAADVGLEVGDRIISVNNVVPRTGDTLAQTLAAANAAGGHVVMLVQDVRGTGVLVIECDLLEEPTGPVIYRSTVSGAKTVPQPVPVMAKQFRAKNIKKTRK